MFGGYLTELGEQNPIVNNTYAIPDYGKIENNEVFFTWKITEFYKCCWKKK